MISTKVYATGSEIIWEIICRRKYKVQDENKIILLKPINQII